MRGRIGVRQGDILYWIKLSRGTAFSYCALYAQKLCAKWIVFFEERKRRRSTTCWTKRGKSCPMHQDWYTTRAPTLFCHVTRVICTFTWFFLAANTTRANLRTPTVKIWVNVIFSSKTYFSFLISGFYINMRYISLQFIISLCNSIFYKNIK